MVVNSPLVTAAARFEGGSSVVGDKQGEGEIKTAIGRRAAGQQLALIGEGRALGSQVRNNRKEGERQQRIKTAFHKHKWFFSSRVNPVTGGGLKSSEI